MPENNGMYATSFMDSKGESWSVPWDLNSQRRAFAKTGIRLDQLFDAESESYKRFWTDQFVRLDCLYALLEPQCTARGVDETEFAARVSSEELLDSASTCIVRAILNFALPDRRRALGTLLDKSLERRMKMATQAVQAVDQINLDEVPQLITGSFAGNSQESAELTPDL